MGMVRLSFAPLLLAAGLFAGCGPPAAPTPEPAQSAQTEKDLVCGMKVDPKTSPSSTYEGKKYYFCCLEDKAEFDKNPGKFVQKK